MDGGAWWGTVHGVTKSRTRLSDFTFSFNVCFQVTLSTHPTCSFLPPTSATSTSLVPMFVSPLLPLQIGSSVPSF